MHNFSKFLIHVEQNQMKIVCTISIKMVMCAEVIDILSKGSSERLYLRNSCTYNGILITILLWIQIYHLFFYFEDCPAGYFGKNCNDKCKHFFYDFITRYNQKFHWALQFLLKLKLNVIVGFFSRLSGRIFRK